MKYYLMNNRGVKWVCCMLLAMILFTGCSFSEYNKSLKEAQKEAKRVEKRYSSECEQAIRDTYGDDIKIKDIECEIDSLHDALFSIPSSAKASDILKVDFKKDGKSFIAFYNIVSKEIKSDYNTKLIKQDIEGYFDKYVKIDLFMLMNSSYEDASFGINELSFDTLNKESGLIFVLYTDDDISLIPNSVFEKINSKMSRYWNFTIVQTEKSACYPSVIGISLCYEDVPVRYDNEGNAQNAFEILGIMKTVNISNGYVNILDKNKGRIYYTIQ